MSESCNRFRKMRLTPAFNAHLPSCPKCKAVIRYFESFMGSGSSVGIPMERNQPRGFPLIDPRAFSTLPKSVAKLLMDFVGERKSGLLFCCKKGKPLNQSNIINRWLHPMLEQLKAPKAGNHAFRRFRITHLRRNLVPKDLEHFWMGHADEEIGDLYSKLTHDVQYRKDVAERVGVGFEVPARLNSKVVSISVRKTADLDLNSRLMKQQKLR